MCPLRPLTLSEAILKESVPVVFQLVGFALRLLSFMLWSSDFALILGWSLLGVNLSIIMIWLKSCTLLSITYACAFSKQDSMSRATMDGFDIVLPWILCVVIKCASLRGNWMSVACDETSLDFLDIGYFNDTLSIIVPSLYLAVIPGYFLLVCWCYELRWLLPLAWASADS